MPRRRSVATKWKLEGAERRPERHAATVGAALRPKERGHYSSAATDIVNPDPGSAAGAIGQVEGPAITQCFCDVVPRDGCRAFQIGQCTGHPQYPVIAARRQSQSLGGALQQGAAGRVGRRDLVEKFAVRLGIRADAAVRR